MKPLLLILALTVSAFASKPVEKIETHTDVINVDGNVEQWTFRTVGKRMTVTVRDASGKIVSRFVFTLEVRP